MTRHDTILKWISYLIAMALVTVVNYYVLGPLPIALPLLLPVLAVAGVVRSGAKPSAKAQSFRCASSPHKAKGRLCGGPFLCVDKCAAEGV